VGASLRPRLPDCPAFASIARGRARLFLSEHRGDARPGTLIARGRARLFLSEHRGDARPGTLVVLEVSDVDAVVAEFGRPDGEPPYGCELELRDLDGNRLRISRLAS